MREPIAWVALAVLVCALLVVQVRQENRSLFSELQKLRQERDGLDTEWSRLLLEEGALSQHQRVETAARTRLNMSLPGAEQIVVVRVAGEAAP
jgi:cell division protein FtsL